METQESTSLKAGVALAAKEAGITLEQTKIFLQRIGSLQDEMLPPLRVGLYGSPDGYKDMPHGTIYYEWILLAAIRDVILRMWWGPITDSERAAAFARCADESVNPIGGATLGGDQLQCWHLRLLPGRLNDVVALGSEKYRRAWAA